jgi:hypothetical protein
MRLALIRINMHVSSISLHVRTALSVKILNMSKIGGFSRIYNATTRQLMKELTLCSDTPDLPSVSKAFSTKTNVP